MLSNYIYVGDYQHRKRIKDEETQTFKNVCPAIIDRKTFEIVQKQKEKIKEIIKENILISLCKVLFVLNVIKLWVVHLVLLKVKENIFITNVIIVE